MRNKTILKLVSGFGSFREKYFGEDTDFSKTFEGQSPKTMLIGCSDSRVDPAILYSTSPGELFIVRNIANLVPPYETASKGRHGVSAAIEFAVVNLKVENIVVMGHRQCGGIRALMSGPQEKNELSFVSSWMEIAHSARKKIIEKFSGHDFETQCKECEKEGIVTSLQNLKTFPFVVEAIKQKKLEIYGIYFDLEQGALMEYNEGTQTFQTLSL